MENEPGIDWRITWAGRCKLTNILPISMRLAMGRLYCLGYYLKADFYSASR